VFFQTVYDEIELKKSIITPFPLRHRICVTKNVTKIASQDFSILGPTQSKFLATSVRKCETVKFVTFSQVCDLRQRNFPLITLDVKRP